MTDNPDAPAPSIFRLLPADDLATFADELLDVLDTPAAARQVIAEWRHTAEIYADPELLAALRSTTVEDHGVVAEPRGEPASEL
ncbi:hypothetical protein OG394_25225 [Kribbella sp. NBC_01245]|uniref:hypothetical protein n=1 Tax=Kribbella sp. NBC_01245 TaxID=2903578 RepID=UPI002E2AE057|nr:hypothetical protein [Kribbella sp. NBC_01245]